MPKEITLKSTDAPAWSATLSRRVAQVRVSCRKFGLLADNPYRVSSSVHACL